MEDVQLTAGSGVVGAGPLPEANHFSPQDSTDVVIKAEHGIKTSDLRSSPHPITNNFLQHYHTTPLGPERNASAPAAAEQPFAPDGADVQEPEGQAQTGAAQHDPFAAVHPGAQLPLDFAANMALGGLGDYGAFNMQDPRILNEDLGSISLHGGEPSVDSMSMLDAATSMIGSEAPRIQAFAKLEFDDGQFYMNTWAVELGRDMRAARRALHQELEATDQPERHNSSASRHRSNSSVDGAHGPLKMRKEETRKVASSVMSETGGILNYDPDGKMQPKGRKAKSEGSTSHNVSRRNSIVGLGAYVDTMDHMNPADLSLDGPTNVVQPVNPQVHLPSPDECPLSPIHPPASANVTNTGHRGISRRHVRIAYNFEKRLFEMEVKGRNGAFVDEDFYSYGEFAELRNGSYIQIGGVGIRFILPNVAVGETGAEGTQASEAVSAMSFDFEDGRGDNIAMADLSDSASSEPGRNTSSEEDKLARRARLKVHDELSNDDSDLDEDDEDEEEEEIAAKGRKVTASKKPGKRPPSHSQPKLKIKLKTKAKPALLEKEKESQRSKESPKPEVDAEAIRALGIDIPLSMIPPRRKGPGRPPKNGFMSKREEASLKKQAREAAKAQAAAEGMLSTDPAKNPVESLEKRKYVKRKDKLDGADIRESIEGSDMIAIAQAAGIAMPKPVKEKKPPKPPKSPSPVIDEASLTPEQLAKPQQSYVVLIHEALSNCPTGQMSLPQIYKAIERRYPYFKFKVQTVGWQSSIRHNLSQHPAFCKIEREGKGWMWGLVPEVSIEKEKRPRRPSPPTMSQQSYYPQGPHMFRPPFPYQGVPQANANGGPPPGQFMYPPLPPSGAFPRPDAVKGPNGVPLPLGLPQTGTSSTYQSPYTSSAPQTSGSQATSQAPTPSQPPSQQAQPAAHAPDRPTSSAQDTPANSAQPSTLSNTSPIMSPSQQPAHAQPASTIASNAQGREPLSHATLNAVERFKNIMIESLKERPNPEQIVTRAINRTLGLPIPDSDSAQKDSLEETAIMDALSNMLKQIRNSERQEKERMEREHQSTTPAAAQPAAPAAPAPSNALAQAAAEQSPQSGSMQSQPEGTVPAQEQIPPAQSLASQPVSAANASAGLPLAASPSGAAAQEHAPPSSSQQPAHEASPTAAAAAAAVAATPAEAQPHSSPGTVAEPASPSRPLQKAEKDQLLSLLSQLGQPPSAGSSSGSQLSANGASASPPAAKNAGSSGPGPSDQSPVAVGRGTKRPLETDEPDAAFAGHAQGQEGGIGDLERSRAKRVAV